MKRYRKTLICAGGAILFAMILTIAFTIRKDRMVSRLSKEVFRFHVLANSDSEEDQSLKMQVKEAVISYIHAELPDATSVDETKTWVSRHLPEITSEAQQVVNDEAYAYVVQTRLVRDSFPEKTYGDVTLPAGVYDALRIEIGKAKGRNWWCVLYPSLCFTDAVHGVVSEEGKEDLQRVLDEDTYDMVLHPRKWKIRFFFFG